MDIITKLITKKMKREVFGISVLLIMMLFSITTLMAAEVDSTSAYEKKIYFTIKLGQGGFRDSRSPIGKLGGGQLAICAQHIAYPVALSFSSEYYTNSADPTNPYEISSLFAINSFYSKYFFCKEIFICF
jgi:hypothetical protein